MIKVFAPTGGPLDYNYTNFEDTNVITESVICSHMYYILTWSLIKEFEPRLQIPPSPYIIGFIYMELILEIDGKQRRGDN